MLEESHNKIALRIERFGAVDSALCRALSSACATMRDEESAVGLLRRLREHMEFTEDRNKLFDADYLLEYVKDSLDLIAALSANPVTDEFKEHIRDTYEVLLYNKPVLRDVLSDAKRAHTLDEKRKNYWRN